MNKQFNESDTVGSEKCITLMVVDDSIADPDEQFTINISSTNSRVMFTRDTTTVVIIDNDGKGIIIVGFS